ncbi:MAG: dihydroorotate dehydrogenase [Patescibacteria group bacterium]
MTTLQTTFCGVEFENPLILPSGIITEIPAHKKAEDAGAGGVTLKSFTVQPREGHPLPRIIKYDHGFLNSVGLRNAGIEKGKEAVKEYLLHAGVPTIVSVFATNVKDFVRLAETFAPLNPAMIELNLSCPNVEDEFGDPSGNTAESAGNAVKAVKKVAGAVPLIAKLSPNVASIADVAKSCEAAGADAISAINTVGPGMVIDIKTRKPVLGHLKGGVSGAGIFPVAVAKIYELYDAVKIPILGMGGVTSWQNAVEMMMAGASLVGVGSAVYSKGYVVFEEIKEGLTRYLEENGFNNINEVVGLAHNH